MEKRRALQCTWSANLGIKVQKTGKDKLDYLDNFFRIGKTCADELVKFCTEGMNDETNLGCVL